MRAAPGASGSTIRGLGTYFSILFRPRAAFRLLSERSTWGWAAIAGIGMSLIAVDLSSQAQLHLLALANQQRIAATPIEHQAQVGAAIRQTAGLGKFLLLVGAVLGPWIYWFIVAIVFLAGAAIIVGRVKFLAAWVAVLNSYVVYAVAGLVNSITIALRDPKTINSPLDLLGMPSPGLFVHHDPKLVAFLSAYSVLDVWYYFVVVIALEEVLKLPRVWAVVVTLACSILTGALAASGAQLEPQS